MLAYIIFLSVNDPPPSYIYTLSLHDALPILLFSLLALAFTRYGKIPLGKDGDKPEFSTFSWVAMLFAAGLGIGVMFWGPAEPLTYFRSEERRVGKECKTP